MQAQIPDPKEAYKKVVEHFANNSPLKFGWLEFTTFFQFHEGLFLVKAPRSLESQKETKFFPQFTEYFNKGLSETMQETCEVFFIFQ